MQRAFYAAVLAILGGLVFAPPAAAAEPTVAEAQAIAYAAFPGHCGPELTIEWDTPMLAENGWEGAAIIGDPNCGPIHLVSSQRDTARGCDILVHERGHVVGHEHAQAGVMSPNVDPWPACHPAAAAATLTVRASRSRAQIARSMRYRRQRARIAARRACRR